MSMPEQYRSHFSSETLGMSRFDRKTLFKVWKPRKRRNPKKPKANHGH